MERGDFYRGVFNSDVGTIFNGLFSSFFSFELNISIASRSTGFISRQFGGENISELREGAVKVSDGDGSIKILDKNVEFGVQFLKILFPGDSDGVGKDILVIRVGFGVLSITDIVITQEGESSAFLVL